MKFDDIVIPEGQTITLGQPVKTMDVMINGFSIKETVREVLKESCLYAPTKEDRDFEIEEIAEAIKEAFAVKMRLRQG